uniref:Uncharacterized protein n=1 Tax=Lygus hesperus TaxID=30085 RepID=A0A0K8S3L5_LYGHE
MLFGFCCKFLSRNKFVIALFDVPCVQKRKQEAARAKKQYLDNLKKEKENVALKPPSGRSTQPVPIASTEPLSKLHITPVPNITLPSDLYPNDALDVESKTTPVKPQHLSVATPSVNRSTKPAKPLESNCQPAALEASNSCRSGEPNQAVHLTRSKEH